MEPLQVIAAPSRMRILELVWDREMSAGEIAAEFDVSWSAVSQHLRPDGGGRPPRHHDAGKNGCGLPSAT